jgi:N-methylhydantoinase B
VSDSGGAGRHRGGLGLEYIVRSQGTINLSTQVERVHCEPWGLEGGLSGRGNRVELITDGKRVTDLPNAKVLVARLKKGDGYVMRSGGGGGFGHPAERPIASVRYDVIQGYVSVEAARELYGVVIDPKTFEVDEAATRDARGKMPKSVSGSSVEQ